MKRILNLTSLASLLMIFIATGCYSHWTVEKGNGKVTEQVRNVADFNNIVLKGSANIYVTQGDKCEVKVIADENLMEKIETISSGNNLEIKTKSTSPTKLEIHVTMKDIKGFKIKGSGNVINKTPIVADNLYLNISGSGDMKFNNVTAKGVKVELNGSGDISVSGKAGRAKIDVSGSGNINLEDLEAYDVAVKIFGSGNCSVYAKSSLKTDIFGSGDIRYKGEPKEFVTHKFGSGDIKKIK